MICKTCGGIVLWCGPFSNLTHTECQNCGAVNNQLYESEMYLTDEEQDDFSDSEFDIGN